MPSSNKDAVAASLADLFASPHTRTKPGITSCLHKHDWQLGSPRTRGSKDAPGAAFSTASLTASLQGKRHQRDAPASQSDEALSSIRLVPSSAPALGPNYNLFNSQTALSYFADIRRAAHGVNGWVMSRGGLQ